MRIKKLKDAIDMLNVGMKVGEGNNSAKEFLKMMQTEYEKALNENNKIYFEPIPDK